MCKDCDTEKHFTLQTCNRAVSLWSHVAGRYSTLMLNMKLQVTVSLAEHKKATWNLREQLAETTSANINLTFPTSDLQNSRHTRLSVLTLTEELCTDGKRRFIFAQAVRDPSKDCWQEQHWSGHLILDSAAFTDFMAESKRPNDQTKRRERWNLWTVLVVGKWCEIEGCKAVELALLLLN